MTTDFRALCAELLSQALELIDTGPRDDATIIRHQELFDRARAALAQPEPAADGEVAEMVAVLRADAECITAGQPELMQVTDNQLNRVADLLDCLSQSRLSGSSEEKREALKERLWHRYRTPSHRGGAFIPDRDFDSVFNEACALAQPGPVGPTDEELKAAYWEAFVDAAPCGADESWLSGLRAVAHWGRPAITPVPVSERLPMAEDCDAEGRCWVHQPCAASPEAPDWMLLRSKYASVNYGATYWLPFHALPLPSPNCPQQP
jgi:hypothetical protein